jgi:pyridoxal phosphate enzyme (YggS family)
MAIEDARDGLNIGVSISSNFRSINDRIEHACDLVKRDPKEITLIAVSKGVSREDIIKAYELGVRNFGENRLQEHINKNNDLPNDIMWHFIGKLQTNKINKVVKLFNVIHSLESEKQIVEIDKNKILTHALIQLNLSNEPQKSGISTDKLDELVCAAAKSKYIHLIGLMTIGPVSEDAETARPYFKQLRKLAERIPGVSCLSMGMSNDFEVAIQEGATHIRVGSQLFGVRRN